MAWGFVEIGASYELHACMGTEDAWRDLGTPFCTSSGHHLLLPLTQSLYVNGTLAETDRVMIDIGTGYYVEVRGASQVHQMQAQASCSIH